MKDLIKKCGGPAKFRRITKAKIPKRTVENWQAGTEPPNWVKFFIEFYVERVDEADSFKAETKD